MTGQSILQIIFFISVLLLLVKPFGTYIAKVFQGDISKKYNFFLKLEKWIYRFGGIVPEEEMHWQKYLFSLLIFNACGFLFLYVIQRCQFYLPLNPQGFTNVPSLLAFNTAISFASNTNWQAYPGESTLSYLTQMSGMTVQNFLSAGTGFAVIMALIRGITRKETHDLGNFWVDLVRGVLYILLPLAFIFAIFLSSQGVIQNFKPYQKISTVETSVEKFIPMGPVASQVAIKQIGTNGGGFFNANSAHPFENPNSLTNFLEMLAILLIPASLTFTFGLMIGDKRQGWALLTAMVLILLVCVLGATFVEQQGNPAFTKLDIEQQAIPKQSPGGNMEGKESRFGITESTLWTVATTSASNGSVNSMLDSYMPIGGLIPMWLIQLGEVIFGGVGTGLASMIIFVILTVFLAGLMVGRTPEYLGKKIEPFEIKMVSFIVLIIPIVILILTAVAVSIPHGTKAMGNPGPHGFSEVLYAFSSYTNNNGSAFAGLNANTPFYNFWGGIAMLIGRYWVIIPMLAVAGSLAKKKTVPANAGTLPTHNLLFITLLISVILIAGALTFFPALALGPIVEYLTLWGQYVY